MGAPVMGKWGQDMASERVGVYPGTFDPITSGHMEVVRRSLRLVDKLVIGPATNIGKGPLFSLQERIDIIKDDIADFSEVASACISTMTTGDCAPCCLRISSTQ